MFLRDPQTEQPVPQADAVSRVALAEVAVLGLGYVGLPIARGASAAGLGVIAIDPAARARARAVDGVLRVRAAPAAGDSPDIWVIAVPTPLDRRGQPDLGAVRAALGTVAAGLRPGALVLLVSTCQPGATRRLCAPILEAGGLRIGRDIFLAVSPERENPGQRRFDLHNTPRLVGALEAASLARAQRFWERLGVVTVPVASAEIAECAKLLENTYRLVNIALMGEMHAAFAALGVPTRAVVAAAATKPFGFAPFWPGLGAGGHCIPVDPAYLQREARAAGAPSQLIAAAMRANRRRPARIVGRLRAALGGALAGRRVLVAGVTYKANVPDMRCSAALMLMRGLMREGVRVAWHDPVLAETPACLAGIPRVVGALAHPEGVADAVVLGTPHDAYDLEALGRVSVVTIDPYGLMAEAIAA